MENNKEFNISKEIELLIYCARTNVDQKTKIKIIQLVQENLNWEYLIQKALTHGLIPLLYYNLNQICPEYIPNEFSRDLKSQFNFNTNKNLLMVAELLNILRLLKNNGIKAVPYKGPVLADLIYGNIAFRQFGDLDIFVPKNNIEKAVDIITSNGYESQIKLKKSQELAFLKYLREYKLINVENQIKIELQWKFSVPSISFNSNFENLIFDNKFELTNFYNHQFLNFSNESMFLILCMHNAGHYWGKLKWICDISEFILATKSLDWKMIKINAKKLGILRIVYINLALANKFYALNFDIEKYFKLDKSAESISSRIYDRIMYHHQNQFNFLEKVFLKVRMRENLNNKLIDFSNALFYPTLNVIKNNYLPKRFIKLYYILRFIDLINRYINPLKN